MSTPRDSSTYHWYIDRLFLLAWTQRSLIQFTNPFQASRARSEFWAYRRALRNDYLENNWTHQSDLSQYNGVKFSLHQITLCIYTQGTSHANDRTYSYTRLTNLHRFNNDERFSLLSAEIS